MPQQHQSHNHKPPWSPKTATSHNLCQDNKRNRKNTTNQTHNKRKQQPDRNRLIFCILPRGVVPRSHPSTYLIGREARKGTEQILMGPLLSFQGSDSTTKQFDSAIKTNHKHIGKHFSTKISDWHTKPMWHGTQGL